jgi:protein-tyrosine phosphatase
MPLTTANPKTAILFVCLGNICRSPLAEGVFRSVVDEAGKSHLYHIDSAATGSWHVGNPPDSRMIATANRHNTNISAQICRKITQNDFLDFDLIICMDHSNIRNVEAVLPVGSTANIQMFMHYALGKNIEIPDPYMEGPDGFERVYNMVLEASKAMLHKQIDETSSR